MPLGFQVVADLNQFVLFLKTWRELASGQIASTIQLKGGVMLVTFEVGVGSLLHLYHALLIQHPVQLSGNSSTGS
ncbi:hypothetical protein TorRG33x02_094670 [Trema orientale]|uniref:Uncharacterized protein n=1 Tax=Trema orientale TaxID=63057 RepID=A0A2P5FA62_TREOI|nr:hypothetical protein TorRG33x02_094670 [Trema orientale]